VIDLLHMSTQELSRVQVIQQVVKSRMKQRKAAEQLGLSIRQIKRLKKAYRLFGAKGLISKKRGHPSNHQMDALVKEQALELLRDRYADFGPTLAHEKLIEVHHLQLGVEKVRQLMIQDGLWHPRHAQRPGVHPLRARRPRFGELVQLDGSPFDWFEGRAPACTLLVYIDDATSRLMELFFTEAETTFSYFEATEQYLTRYGKPKAFYSDKLSVFRVNLPTAVSGDGTTQFGRAMHQLDVQLLCANTPQAKGRVERANQLLQDRLVKEMRLRGVSNIAAGNAFVPEFIADLNARFAVEPQSQEDAHRPLLPQDDLERILSVQELRHLSKNLTLQYHNAVYQIQTARPTYSLRQAQVVVRENQLGAITIEYHGKPLAYTIYREATRQAEVTPSKLIELALTPSTPSKKKRPPYIPPADHPWRRFIPNAKSKE
jgi:transposase